MCVENRRWEREKGREGGSSHARMCVGCCMDTGGAAEEAAQDPEKRAKGLNKKLKQVRRHEECLLIEGWVDQWPCIVVSSAVRS